MRRNRIERHQLLPSLIPLARMHAQTSTMVVHCYTVRGLAHATHQNDVHWMRSRKPMIAPGLCDESLAAGLRVRMRRGDTDHRLAEHDNAQPCCDQSIPIAV